jgi:hypothetical protein
MGNGAPLLCLSTVHDTIRNMSNDTETARYYVRGTDPTNNEQIAFECVGLAVANAKAAELRMGGYRDVILSVAKASEGHDPTSADPICMPPGILASCSRR